MGKFLLKRTFHIIVTMILFISITFLIFQLTPGDATQKYIANPNLSMADVARIQEQFGLNDPWYTQYFRYMRNVFTGNLGLSFSRYPRPVWDIISVRIPRTIVLFLTSRLLSFYIGFFLGKIIAWKRGSFVDTATTVVGISFWTMFYPLLAIINIWFFGYLLDWFPISGFVDPFLWRGVDLTSNTVFAYIILTGFLILGAWLLLRQYAKKPDLSLKVKKAIVFYSPFLLLLIGLGAWITSGYARYAWDILYHMVLPVLTLTLISFGQTMLLTRDSMMETIQEDYIMVAKAKGLMPKVIRDKYAARTAMLPVVTSLALSLGTVLSGGVITETLFSWPGLGLTLLEAAQTQDIPLAMGAFAFTGVFVLVAHLIADLLYAILDPRISTDNL
ncbi:ABC transporter permease [Natronospora cellulosivora (SeqCode)]